MSSPESTNKKQKLNPIFGFFTEVGIIEHLANTQMEKVLPDQMKASHFSVLNHLVRLNKKESPAELANAFQVARPSMTNTIQKLTKKHYVTVKADPQDGRGKQVMITETGRQAHQQALIALSQGFSTIAEDLGEELFSSVLPALQKIRHYMDNQRG